MLFFSFLNINSSVFNSVIYISRGFCCLSTFQNILFFHILLFYLFTKELQYYGSALLGRNILCKLVIATQCVYFNKQDILLCTYINFLFKKKYQQISSFLFIQELDKSSNNQIKDLQDGGKCTFTLIDKTKLPS